MAHTVLRVIDSEEYFARLLEVVKEEAGRRPIVYVTTNKPYTHLINKFTEEDIPTDDIFFIDAISKHIGEVPEKEPENCLLLDSPKNLTQISIAVNESVSEGEKLVLLDSLSVLLVYNDATTIGKFSNFLINKLRAQDTDTIILALESDVDKDIIKQIESVVDEVTHNGD